MLNNAPLPFPLETPPDSWAADGLYHDIMNDFTTRWKTAGYSWKFGQEINFYFQMADPKGFANEMDAEPDDNTAQAIQERLWQAYALTVDPALSKTINARIDAMRAFFKTDEAQDFADSVNRSVKDLKMEFAGFMRGLKSRRYDEQVHARMGLCLSWLHMMSYERGGARDLIEPRFGDAHYGAGWWDEPPPSDDEDKDVPFTLSGDVEMRLTPQDSYSIINSYHQILPVIVKAAEDFGLSAEFPHDTGTQLHLSLWHNASGRNVTRMDTPEDAALWEKVINGYLGLLQAGPALIRGHAGIALEYAEAFRAGSSRMNHLRQKPDSLELRNATLTRHLHTARQIAMFLAGGWHGFNGATPKKPEYTALNGEPTAIAPQAASFLSFLGGVRTQTERVVQPVVQHRHDLTHSAIVSILENAEIKPDGRLKASSAVILSNISRLVDEVGVEACFDAKIPDPRDSAEEVDFHELRSWEHLLKAVRVSDDNQLIWPDWASPEIVDAFADVPITGRRHVITGAATPEQSGFQALLEIAHNLENNPTLSGIFTASQREELAAFHRDYAREKAADTAQRLARACYRQFLASGTIGAGGLDTSLALFINQILYPSARVLYDGMKKDPFGMTTRDVTREEIAAIVTPLPVIIDAFGGAAADAPDSIQQTMGHLLDFTQRPRHIFRVMAKEFVTEYSQWFQPNKALEAYHFGWQMGLNLIAAETRVPLSVIREQITASSEDLRTLIEARRTDPNMRLAADEFNTRAETMLRVQERISAHYLKSLDALESGRAARLFEPYHETMAP